MGFGGNHRIATAGKVHSGTSELIWEDWDDVSVDVIMKIFASENFVVEVQNFEQSLYIQMEITDGYS